MCSNVTMKLRLEDTQGEILFCDVTKSCDRHGEIPICVVNIVVALVVVYRECRLTSLPEVCNHDLPVPLLVFLEQSIFQVWQLYHAQFVSSMYKWFLQHNLNTNMV